MAAAAAEPQHHFLTDAAAALVASSAFTTAFYPLHRVKTLLQTQDSHPDFQTGKHAKFKFSTSFARLAREQGVASLWRGCLPYMLRHVPSTTLSFAFKDALQRALPAYDPATQPSAFAAVQLACGGAAGVAALAVVYPLEFSTIRQAANMSRHTPGVLSVLEGSVRGGGVRALYRGFGVSAVAIGGYKALYFGLFDIAKAARATASATPSSQDITASAALQTSQRPSESHRPSTRLPQNPSHHLQAHISTSTSMAVTGEGSMAGTGDGSVAGGQDGSSAAGSLPVGQSGPVPGLLASGSKGRDLLVSWALASAAVCLASTATYPLDVVRKRLVVDSSAPPEQRQFTGAWDCARKVAAREGVAGFYRFYLYDMLLRLGGGVLLVMYDELRGGLAKPRGLP